MQARVRALRSSEQQLHVLMERADAVADILAISRELSRVTGELEAQQSVAQRLSSCVYSSVPAPRCSTSFLGRLSFDSVGTVATQCQCLRCEQASNDVNDSSFCSAADGIVGGSTTTTTQTTAAGMAAGA